MFDKLSLLAIFFSRYKFTLLEMERGGISLDESGTPPAGMGGKTDKDAGWYGSAFLSHQFKKQHIMFPLFVKMKVR